VFFELFKLAKINESIFFEIFQAHKKLNKTVKEQMGFSDYGMYWLAFLEGGLTIWLLDRIFFHWLKF